MAKEDVQVIYEEADDEYWMKPLREAIVNVGNSWAGAIVRKQHYANEYANNAANRAHEAFLAQMNNRSTERVAGMKLGADIARYKVLDKQYKEGMELKTRIADREDAIFEQDQTDRYRAVQATEAVNKLYTNFEKFAIDPNTGNVILKELDKDQIALLNRQMAMSPAINAQFKEPLMKRKARRQDIAGRMQMLKTLQKKYGNESVISHILYQTDPKATEIAGIPLDGHEGTEGYQNLQALGRAVSNDQTWSDILKSYGMDKATVKDMPKHQYEDMTNFAWMLTNNNLEAAVGGYKGTALQNAMVKAYTNNLEQFQVGSEKNTQFADALLAGVSDMNLTVAQRDQIGNTNTLLNSGIVEFMHRTNGVFTSPTSLPSSIMAEVSRLVQNPDLAKTDLDKKLLSIANGEFEQAEMDVKVQEVIEEFINKNRYIQNGEYKSILGIKKNDYKKTLASYGGGSQQPAVTPPPAEVVEGTTELRLQPDQNNPSVSKPATLKDIAVAYDNETMHDYHYGGKLYGADGKVLIEDGKIRMDDGSYTDISDPQIATKYWFDQNPEIANSEIGKKLQGKIKTKKDLVAELTEKKHKVYWDGKTDMYSMLDIYEHKAGIDAYNRMYVQGTGIDKKTKLEFEQKRVRDLYKFNRNTAMEVLLANHHSKEMELFTLNADGQLVPDAWFESLHAKSGSTGTVIDVDTHKILEEYERTPPGDAQYEGHQKVAKQLRAMLKALNMSDQSNIIGDEFGVANQLRLLAQEIVQAGGMPKFRYAKVNEGQPSTATALRGSL